MRVDSLISLAQSRKIKYSTDEAMALHTSFKLGGKADIFLCPETAEQMSLLLKQAKQDNIPCFILGKGSNLLVSDGGIEGAVICTDALCTVELVNECEIYAGAGVSLAELCKFAKDNSLTGLEFAYGIPGSVGGALYMNAGAYGGDMSQVVVSAKSLDKEQKIISRSVEDMELGYRKSIFEHSGEVILGVTFKLEKGDKEKIAEDMNTIIAKRMKSQPLDYPSAGSTFKRPEGYFAAALIDECGLKGLSVGDAQVSTKHAGFVINKGNATCKDVLDLIEVIKEKVLTQKGVSLETEVIFVGRK